MFKYALMLLLLASNLAHADLIKPDDTQNWTVSGLAHYVRSRKISISLRISFLGETTLQLWLLLMLTVFVTPVIKTSIRPSKLSING